MEIGGRYSILLRMLLFSFIAVFLYSCGSGSSGGANTKLQSTNLLTDWAEKRASVLINKNGKSPTEAMRQSEEELATLFGIRNIHELDINQPEKFPAENALLLLLTGALVDVANKNSLDKQLIINDISQDFSIDGKLTEKGDAWFLRMQAMIRDNPASHLDQYARVFQSSDRLKDKVLSAVIPLASRPVAIVPREVFAKPGETIFLDGSASHDNNSGDIINYTWFRVDQKRQFVVPLSNRFSDKPSITAPNQETELLFSLVVTDEEKLTHIAIVKVIVREPPENTPPVADSQTIETNEDTPVDIILTGSDADPESVLSFVIDTPLLLSNGILEGAVPNLTYTPTANFFGTDSFTFKVNDGFEDSLPATVDISVKPVNDPPVADAGLSQSVKEAEVVTLSGSGADLEDGSNISYEWTAPDVVGITLDDPSSPNPTFVAPAVNDTPVTHTFSLIVRDTEGLASLADSVSITVSHENLAPLANAGNDQTVIEQTQFILSGSGSDPEDGENISYEWTAPDGITLDNPNSATPSFTTPAVSDTPVTLVFTLIVRDTQELASSPDSVKITIKRKNLAPTANAGFSKTVLEGTRVFLSGSGSDPEDGNNVTFHWIAPHGIFLTNSTTARPSFTAPTVGDLPRTLIFSLIVKDTDGLASLPASVRITVKKDNKSPKADAGKNQTVTEGTEVTLHGSGSDPEDGANVTFRWIAPAKISLKNSTTATPSFIAPAVDESPVALAFTLIVRDSKGLFSFDTVVITVITNHAPIAKAGDKRSEKVGVLVTLDGSQSSDPDGDTLSYHWSLITRPTDSSASLDDPTAVKPHFTIDIPGTYIAQLIVNDGSVDSEADTVTINTENSKPIANIIASSNVHVDITNSNPVILDGSNSYDPDNDNLTFVWELESPDGSFISLPNVDKPAFHPTKLGSYKATLIVNDGSLNSDSYIAIINSGNTKPIANAGTPPSGKFVYDTFNLDGSASNDNDNDILSYHWLVISTPQNSAAYSLSNENTKTPTFQAYLEGSYTVQLIVNDGIEDSVPATMTFFINQQF